jgi:hypothetical protein
VVAKVSAEQVRGTALATTAVVAGAVAGDVDVVGAAVLPPLDEQAASRQQATTTPVSGRVTRPS